VLNGEILLGEVPGNGDHIMGDFKVLSLDGGGIRGAFSASFLATIESHTGNRASACFDLYAGTSTGGIVATALAAGFAADQIVEFYRERGPEIFTPYRPKLTCRQRLVMRAVRCLLPAANGAAIFHAKYDGNALREALSEVFGSRTLGDLDRRLLLPSVNLVKGQTKVFKTPHLTDYFHDASVSLIDAVMATTAAPTYFPAAVLDAGSAYCDGGVWANNPAIVAYAEVCRMAQNLNKAPEPRAIAADEVAMLSIGTGRRTYSFEPPGCQAGLAVWGTRLFEVPSTAQAQGAVFQACYLLGERYKRIDYDLPDKSWELDSVEVIEKLIHLGRETAAEQLRYGVEKFFHSVATPFK